MNKINRIQQALISLLQTKSYQSLTISSIMAEAQLPRTSFYNFYDSKDDLAQAVIMTTLSKDFDYITQKFRTRNEDDRVTTIGLADLLNKQETITQLWKITAEREDMKQQLKAAFRTSIQSAVQKKWPGVDPENLSYFANLFAACCLETITWSLDRSKPIDPDRMAQLVNTCLYDGMIQLLKDHKQ